VAGAGEGADDAGTRRRVLQLVASDGPVCATELAELLELTPTGVRRHLAELERDGQIAVHQVAVSGVRRGRPARRYVVTGHGQAALAQDYAALALDAVRFLHEEAGHDAVVRFAERRAAALATELAQVTSDEDDDTAARTQAVAEVLDGAGYAATVRPVPGFGAVQLCLGHCPVQDVAEQFPQLCEAETRVLAQVLGVHVQRLSSLAAGGHVCTTNVPARPVATTITEGPD